jgi:DNA repair exonuclease SbcCD ATPase subunit
MGYVNGSFAVRGTAMDHLETGVDRLLVLVNEHHQIPLSHAAQHLQVPKHTVERWTETLEEAGLVATKLTLRETMLISKEGQGAAGVKKVSIIDLFRTTTSDYHEERMLKEHTKELKRQTAALEAKVNELRHYAKIKNQVESTLAQIEAEQRRFQLSQEKFAKDVERIEKARQMLEQERTKFTTHQSRIEHAQQRLLARTRMLDEKERRLQQQEKELYQVVQRILNVKGLPAFSNTQV